MDTAWIALIGTLLGGAGLKVTEKVLARGGEEIDVATKMREELREESAALKEELREADKQLDLWKEKYFALMAEYLDIKSQVAHEAPVKKEKDGGDW